MPIKLEDVTKDLLSPAPDPLPIKAPVDTDTLLINWGATLICGILLVIAFTSWQNEVTLRHLATLGYTKAKVGQVVPLR
jgi:hypothetical protein